MLAHHQLARVVERQTVGARLTSGESRGSGIAGRLQEFLEARRLRPFPDHVSRNVGEQHALVGNIPDRSFGPLELVRGQQLDARILIDQPVERGIQPLDPAQRRRRLRQAEHREQEEIIHSRLHNDSPAKQP